MSRATHTPGPWEIDWRVGGYVYCRDRTGAVVACALSNGPRDQAELDANGRLIAAAPELLAALRRAEGDIRALAAGGRPATGGDRVPQHGPLPARRDRQGGGRRRASALAKRRVPGRQRRRAMTPAPSRPERIEEIERAERLVRERNAEKGVQWWERATDLLMKAHFSDAVRRN